MSVPEQKPDCVHCRYMLRTVTGEYRCKQHDMVLHTPVSLFCRHLTAPENDGQEVDQWINNGVDRSRLQTGLLYTWVEMESTPHTAESVSVPEYAVYVPFVRIIDYILWPAGTFWKELRQIRERYNSRANR